MGQRSGRARRRGRGGMPGTVIVMASPRDGQSQSSVQVWQCDFPVDDPLAGDYLSSSWLGDSRARNPGTAMPAPPVERRARPGRFRAPVTGTTARSGVRLSLCQRR